MSRACCFKRVLNHPFHAKLPFLIIPHLMLCLASATHNFKWAKKNYAYLLKLRQNISNLDVLTLIRDNSY